MDLRMPRMDGVETTRRIRADHPDTRVLVLTTYSDDESILAALRAGACGYLTKNARPSEIADAIAAVMGGASHLEPFVQRRLAAMATRDRPSGSCSPNGLTPRELDVLALIAEGRSNTEIAGQLYITEGTVKTHVNRLFAKAGLRDRAQAVTYAFRHGLVSALPPEHQD
jgi:DNA-binding NarL/FixJ family response regulator